MKPLIRTILKNAHNNGSVSVHGWIQSVRKMKNVAFADVTDGSSPQPLNVVFENPQDAEILTTGTCIKIDGTLVKSKGRQDFELQAKHLSIFGQSPNDYPLQKKYHSKEFLRQLPHLRWKSKQAAQVLKYRNWALQSMKQFFDENDVVQVSSPILTSSDCEGAGKVFEISKSKEFFGEPAFLTVSSQLHLEVYAAALSRVWNLTPAFRAETSDTNRHLSEFWLVEAEICFLDDLRDLIFFCERMVRSALPSSSCAMGMDLVKSKWNDEARVKMESRWAMASKPWEVITYTEAIELLNKSRNRADGSVAAHLPWGSDLPSEHEKFLANEIVAGPVVVIDYPEQIKPFYMKRNDERTVSCFDVLFPEVGEIVGGSIREDNYDLLMERMRRFCMNAEKLRWYTDLRKYGSSPHGGYGLGFERLVMYMCGLDNIRDATGFIRGFGQLPC